MSYERHSSRWGGALRGTFFLAALFAAHPAHAQTESDAYAIDGVRLTMPEDALISPSSHDNPDFSNSVLSEGHVRSDETITVTATRPDIAPEQHPEFDTNFFATHRVTTITNPENEGLGPYAHLRSEEIEGWRGAGWEPFQDTGPFNVSVEVKRNPGIRIELPFN